MITSYIKKLISLLILENRTDQLNALIGFLNSRSNINSWQEVVEELIKLDYKIIELFLEEQNTNVITTYGILLNKCYQFINEEYNISFIEKAPFKNERVANTTDFNRYVIARRTYLNEYEKDKEVSI